MLYGRPSVRIKTLPRVSGVNLAYMYMCFDYLEYCLHSVKLWIVFKMMSSCISYYIV